MARLVSESFESGFILAPRWTISGTPEVSTNGAAHGLATTALDGSRSMFCGGGANNDFIVFFPATATAEIYYGFYYRADFLPSAGNVKLICGFNKNGSAPDEVALRIDSTGQIRITIGPTTTASATGAILTVNTKYHIQFHVLISDASGVFQVKVDDNSSINFSGDTKNGAVTLYDRCSFGVDGNYVATFDNILINDTSGASDNSWTGIRKFYTLTVVGPGFYAENWSRVGDTPNWKCVDEIPHDGDTTYLSTTVDSVYESFSMSDQALGGVTYDALLTSVVCKKDSGTKQLKVGVRQAGANYLHAGQDLNTTYGILDDRRIVDPSTGLSWVSGGINGVESLIVSSAPGT